MDRIYYENICRDDKINAVFHGWVDDPWSQIDEADYLISTSNYEGFGMSISEAITRGIPVISSNCPVGPNDLVMNGINGFLYPLHDVEKLHQILQDCMNNQYLWDREVIRHSLDKFSVENYIDRINKSLEYFI